MLLTGADTHLAGYGTMAGEFTPKIRGQPGYETYLSDRVTTIASVLQANDYHTYIAGKWDMGGHGNPVLWPDQRGFEESYVLVEGSASHYDKGLLPVIQAAGMTLLRSCWMLMTCAWRRWTDPALNWPCCRSMPAA